MRIGLHCNNLPDEAKAIRYIETVQPPLCKFLLGGFTRRVLDACRANGVKTVLRVHTDDQTLLRQVLGNGGPRPRRPALTARGAASFVDTAVGLAVEHGFDYVEGYNEVYQSGAELARYAEFDISLMQAAEQRGVKAMIGSFSTGNPPDSWQPYVPALRYAGQHGHVVGLHEYSAPVMQWGAGRNQWHGGAYVLDDPVLAPDALGWWTLRYRRARAEWRTLGINPLPNIAITESGIDDIQPRPANTPGRGWRTTLGTEWENKQPFGSWADQMCSYAWQLSQDAYIVGAVSFGWGALDPNWHNFRDDIDQERLAVFMAAQLTLPRGAVTPTPTPAPTPQPSKFFQALQAEFPGAIDLSATLPQHATLRYAAREVAKVERMVLHHTAASRTGSWQGVAAYHVVTNGWPGIGYTFGVSPDGAVALLNPLEISCYHVGSPNASSIGICVPGDYRSDRPTEALADALQRLVSLLRSWTGKRDLPVVAHGDVPGNATECPGQFLRALLPGLNVAPTPPTPAPSYTLTDLRRATYAQVGAPGTNAYTPDYALQKFATAHAQGGPLTPEFVFGPWTARGFAESIIYAVTGNWGDVRALPW